MRGGYNDALFLSLLRSSILTNYKVTVRRKLHIYIFNCRTQVFYLIRPGWLLLTANSFDEYSGLWTFLALLILAVMMALMSHIIYSHRKSWIVHLKLLESIKKLKNVQMKNTFVRRRFKWNFGGSSDSCKNRYFW